MELLELLTEPITPPTKEELLALVKKMEMLKSAHYSFLFASGIGGEAHAFMEFNGMMGVYIEMCYAAANKNMDFRFANAHNGTAIPMASHHAKYLGEKIDCVFGPSLRAHPEAAKAFLVELGFARTSFLKAIGEIDVQCTDCTMLESECDDCKTKGFLKCCPDCHHELKFRKPKREETDEQHEAP